MAAPIFYVALAPFKGTKSSLKKKLRVTRTSSTSSIQEAISSRALKAPVGSRAFSHDTEVLSFKPPKPFGEPRQYKHEYLLEKSYNEPIQVLENQKILITYANINLPLNGILKRAKDGGYDLDLIPSYLRLFRFGGIQETSPCVRIIYPNEELKRDVTIGTQFNFRIKGFYSSRPQNMKGVKKVWYIGLESKELRDYRASLGLTELPYGHDFHLLLSKEKGESNPPRSSFRINNSFCFC